MNANRDPKVELLQPGAVFLCLVVAGCGAPAPSQPPPTTSPLEPVATAPVASAAPTEPPSQPTPEPPAAPSEPTVELAMHPAVKGLEHVWKLGDTLMVSYGSSIALIQNGKLEKRDDLSRQLGANFFHPIQAAYGQWPDMVFVEMIGTDGRSGWSELYAMRNGKSFAPVAGARLPTNWRYIGVSPWTRGSWIAMEVNTMPWGPPPHVRFNRVRGPNTGPLPVLPRSAVTEDCPVDFSPSNMIALESGEVFATGTGCQGEAIVYFWPAGQTTAQVTKFPGDRQQPWSAGSLVGSSASDVVATWSGGQGALAVRYDGTHWVPFEMPTQGDASLSMSDDGTLWQFSSTGTRKRQGDAWVRVAPLRFGDKEMQIDGVFSGAQGELWATAGDVLWHSEKPEELVTLEYEHGQEQRGTINIPRAADWLCRDIFVLMYGMTKVTPKNYDYPLTRKALKGHTEFASAEFAETEDGGRHYFGAFVPELDLARKMATIVEKKVPGSKPQVLCVKPRVVRRLTIDMQTGDVVANVPVTP